MHGVWATAVRFCLIRHLKSFFLFFCSSFFPLCICDPKTAVEDWHRYRVTLLLFPLNSKTLSDYFQGGHNTPKKLRGQRRQVHCNEADLSAQPRWPTTCKMCKVKWLSHVTMTALPSWSPRSPSKPSGGVEKMEQEDTQWEWGTWGTRSRNTDRWLSLAPSSLAKVAETCPCFGSIHTTALLHGSASFLRQTVQSAQLWRPDCPVCSALKTRLWLVTTVGMSTRLSPRVSVKALYGWKGSVHRALPRKPLPVQTILPPIVTT